MTDWADHLKKFKKSNPDISHVDALKEAKKTYKTKSKGKSSETKSKSNSFHVPRGARPRNSLKLNKLGRNIAIQETMLDVQKKLPTEMRTPILKTIDPVQRRVKAEQKQQERKLDQLSGIVGEVPEDAKTMNSNQLRQLITQIKEQEL